MHNPRTVRAEKYAMTKGTLYAYVLGMHDAATALPMR